VAYLDVETSFFYVPRSLLGEIFPKETQFPRLLRLSLFGFDTEESNLISFLGNSHSQEGIILDLLKYCGPGCLKVRVEHFVIHGGTFPLDVAVGIRQDEVKKSRVRFHDDEAWVFYWTDGETEPGTDAPDG
jgi:hypothetical protein